MCCFLVTGTCILDASTVFVKKVERGGAPSIKLYVPLNYKTPISDLTVSLSQQIFSIVIELIFKMAKYTQNM
jgi:hypothetical protein